MKKITLETESYLIEGKENARFFPFLELEYNEDVIYEKNDIPKYYLSFSEDLKSAYGIEIDYDRIEKTITTYAKQLLYSDRV